MQNWFESETEILQQLVANKSALCSAISPMLSLARGSESFERGESVLIAINVPRGILGLDPHRKPGDIDLLIAPACDAVVNEERIIAVEAKVIRPTSDRPARNANSLGRTQTLGLLDDGFPFVGLLHLVVPEPIPEDLQVPIPLVCFKGGGNGRIVRMIRTDFFPANCATRQYGRLMAADLPPEVTFHAIGLNSAPLVKKFTGYTVNEWEHGAKNPRACSELATRVRSLFESGVIPTTGIRWIEEEQSDAQEQSKSNVL